MAYPLAPPPLLPPVCHCRITHHDPRDFPDRRWWTWQITSICPTHFRQVPVSVRVRILINEGVRL